MWVRASAVGAVAVWAAWARADVVAIHTFIGVTPGHATCSDNRPLLNLSDAAYCLGANCPGIWSSQPIRFDDAGVQANGLGQHPGLPRPCRAEFDLEAVAREVGCGTITGFSARAGVERFSQPGAGANGATMRVYLDGVLAFSADIANGFAPSVPLSLSLVGVRALVLETETLGTRAGNHACWGNAVLTYSRCVADMDDGTGVGQCDGGVTIDDLLFYLDRFGEGDLRADVDDGTGTGTRDGGVTIDDLLYYLVRFEAGC